MIQNRGITNNQIDYIINSININKQYKKITKRKEIKKLIFSP